MTTPRRSTSSSLASSTLLSRRCGRPGAIPSMSHSGEMDFRVGGASLVCMRAPAEYGGQDMYNTWTYMRIDPHERIEFVSNFANKDGAHLDRAELGMPPGVPHDVPHVIIFEAAGDGRTEMTVTEHGYTTEQARDLSS